MMDNAFFGSPGQQAVQRRADALWPLLALHPDYCCHGRAIGVAGTARDAGEKLAALARLQGVASHEGVPADQIAAQRAFLEARGLKMDHFNNWAADRTALTRARDVLASRGFPDDLTMHAVTPDTPAETLQRLDAMTQSCEVLLPMGSFLRGTRRPAVCLYAQDGEGRVVGSAASVAQFHPDSPQSHIAWWGMLATAPDRRGAGISLILGAQTLLAMQDRYGIGHFFTGIRAGNAPSESLCTKLGLSDDGTVVIIAIDPGAFDGDRITK